jgi:hypothetical protein
MEDILRACSLVSAAAFFALALMAAVVDTNAYPHSRYLAAVGGVGVQIGVAPNADNTLAESLRTQEETLAVREQYLKQQELEQASRDTIVYVAVLVGQGILFVLLLLNFYLDHRARTNRMPTTAPVSG